MNENKKIIMFLIAIPLAAILIIFMVSQIKFAPFFSPIEQKIFTYTHEQTPSIAERKQITVSYLKSPIESVKSSEHAFPKTTLSELAPPPGPAEKRLSFILVNQKRKLAIVDGKLLHEGDIVDNHTITRIEKDKILLKSKEGEKWLKIN
ncbi:MAG: hypothetical protein ABFD82_02935 [Syntrophaceae bacterium]